MRELRDFLEDLRNNWNDSYFWLDHQALRVALLALVSGFIGLLFVYLEARIQAGVRGGYE